MKEKKITIIINKPIEEVFGFTLNPKNTPLWISSIKEEVTNEFPPKIGTLYKNRGDGPDWTIYKVTEFEQNKSFTLTKQDGNYSVRYTFKHIDDNTTEIEYFEWVNEGELEEPFTKEILEKLKSVMEN